MWDYLTYRCYYHILYLISNVYMFTHQNRNALLLAQHCYCTKKNAAKYPQHRELSITTYREKFKSN